MNLMLNECRSTCLKTLECTHYTWNITNGHETCWMKNGTAEKRDALPLNNQDSSTACGIVTKVNWQSGGRAEDCDIPGHDLFYKTTSQTGCYELCLNTSTCTGYVWNETCWLKHDELSKGDAIYVDTNKTQICGIMENPNTKISTDNSTQTLILAIVIPVSLVLVVGVLFYLKKKNYNSSKYAMESPTNI